MRTYNIICPSCKGTGINPYIPQTPNEICPACHGNKIVMCTDNSEIEIVVKDNNPFPWATETDLHWGKIHGIK